MVEVFIEMKMKVFKGLSFSGGIRNQIVTIFQWLAYFIRLDQALMNGCFSEPVFQGKDFIYSTLTIQK